jgi:hypothetical protein
LDQVFFRVVADQVGGARVWGPGSKPPPDENLQEIVCFLCKKKTYNLEKVLVLQLQKHFINLRHF